MSGKSADLVPAINLDNLRKNYILRDNQKNVIKKESWKWQQKRSVSTFHSSGIDDDIGDGKDFQKTEESESSSFVTNYEDANKMKLTVVCFDKV